MSFTEAQIEAARAVIYELAGMRFADKTIRAALEAAERAAWRPVSEAPKDGTLVLTYWPTLYGAEQYSVRSWQTGDWGRIRAGWADCWMQIKPNNEPTHFRHLPAPPEGTPAR